MASKGIHFRIYQEITNKMEELNTKLSIKENRWYELLKMEADLVSA